MRAAVLQQPGNLPVIEEIPTPAPAAGEVLVKVTACGVCHTDLHVMKGEVPFPTPAVLGHEISATVVQCGDGVTAVAPGDPVVGAFVMPCGTCRACVVGRDDLCGSFFSFNRLRGVLYDGTTRLRDARGKPLAMYSMAGLAEYAVLPATAVHPLPPSLSQEAAAVLGCAFLTAYGAARHAGDVRPGGSVAVVACGGVGTALVQVSRAFGARQVIAIDVSPAKLENATRNGATHAVVASGSTTAEVHELTGGGVDVVFEAFGSAGTVSQAIALARDGGTVVLVGLADTSVVGSFALNHLVRRSLTIRGSFGGRVRGDLPHIVGLAATGAIDPSSAITTRFPLEQTATAYEALDAGTITGRALIVP